MREIISHVQDVTPLIRGKGPMTNRFDVLVIGGGPAGATTALLLAQAGYSVAIVEKKEFPRRKVCGEFISATNLPLLNKLGIADFYLTHGGPQVKRVGLFIKDSALISSMPPANSTINPWGRALGREHLDSALLNAALLAGAKLWQPWSADNLSRNRLGFHCTLTQKSQTQELSANIIVLANGSWERDISQINTHSIHKSSDLLAFKAHFENSQLSPDLMPLLAFPGGYGGLVHSDSGRVTLSCCIRRDILKFTRHQYPGVNAGEAVLRHIFQSCVVASEVLSKATRVGSWLSSGPIHPGIRRHYNDGIFYVGNIAGEAHPVIAEGISMAMQSAWLLAKILIERKNDLQSKQGMIAAGQDYSEQWHKHFAKRIYAAAMFAHLVMRPRGLTLLLPLFKQFPKLLTFCAKLSGKVSQVVPES